jgi:hypothetical protein
MLGVETHLFGEDFFMVFRRASEIHIALGMSQPFLR